MIEVTDWGLALVIVLCFVFGLMCGKGGIGDSGVH